MKVLLDIDLKRPCGKSLTSLLDLCTTWRCDIVRLKTAEVTQQIKMPWKSFKDIWGVNPKKGEIEVPTGTEYFISAIRVVQVTVE